MAAQGLGLHQMCGRAPQKVCRGMRALALSCGHGHMLHQRRPRAPASGRRSNLAGTFGHVSPASSCHQRTQCASCCVSPAHPDAGWPNGRACQAGWHCSEAHTERVRHPTTVLSYGGSMQRASNARSSSSFDTVSMVAKGRWHGAMFVGCT